MRPTILIAYDKILALLITALILSACAEEQAVGPVYDTATVERHTIEVIVSSAGIVEPLATVEVKSKASGEVLDLLVETGDTVKQGELMVTIDPRTVRNRLSQSQAELKAALSRLEIAETQKSRIQSLVSKGTLTQTDMEQAILDLANSEAQLVTSRVSVENDQIAVDDTDIRAPISGTVIFKPVEKGQVITSPTQDFSGGTMLMQMADLSAVQIRSLVDETDIGKIKAGMVARVTVAAYPNRPFNGDVLKIEPQGVVEQNVTMFAVLISIQNPDGLLLPGMNADVDISVARSENAISIPVMALRTNRDLVSTADILGRSDIDIRNSLGLLEKESANAGAQVNTNRHLPGRERGPRPASNSQKNSDYRFGGEFWVVLDTKAQEVRQVTTGVTDLNRVEIVRGLDESDRVLVLPSSHLIETQQALQSFIERRGGGVPGIN